jgi:hypothetical protein
VDGVRQVDRLVERALMTRQSPGSGSSHRREPQSGQKALRIRQPLSARRVQNFGVPVVTLRVPGGIRSDMPKADPD